MTNPLFNATPIVRTARTSTLRQLLAFAGRSIDDVVNCPIAKRRVAFFHRVGREIERSIEVDELERQWNPLGRR